jgi:hypothetical protein
MSDLRRACQHGAFGKQCWDDCIGGREPTVEEVIEWLSARPDEWRFALEYEAQLVVVSDE